MFMVCKNCHLPVNTKYCGNCGQKTDTHRITFAALLHDVPHSIFHVDKGLLYTFKELLVRPGKMVAAFLAGERVRHFKPFAYLIILTTIASYLSHLGSGGAAVASEAPSQGSGLQNWIDKAAPFFARYPSLFFLVMIPLVSLITWLYFRKKGYNYWENVVLNIYVTAQFNLLLALLSVYNLLAATPVYSYTPLFFLYFSYVSFAYGQFFSVNKKRVGFLQLSLLILMVALLYVTGLSLSGLMTPWWAW